MKRVIIFLLFFIIFVCAACSEDKPSVSQTTSQNVVTSPATTTPPTAISFIDNNLEQAVRTQIGKPSGDVLPSDVESVEVLYLGQMEIENISGLEYFVSLRDLDLTGNKIEDISSLATLTNLTSLILAENNISDISSLSKLTSLQSLDLRDNYCLTDISVVSNFSELEYIGFSFTNVSDISSLRNLRRLSSLPSADYTPVWDYAPLTDILDDIIQNRKDDNSEADKEWLDNMERDIRETHEKDLQAGQFVRQTLSELISPDMSELEKEFTIFNFVVNHIEYEFGGYDDYSNSELYNMFINQKGICNNYATAFSILCNASGIECFMVQGTVDETEDHVWNIVSVYGEYYQIDTTWADQEEINYDYFNRSTSAMYANGLHKSSREDYDKECPRDFTEEEMREIVPSYIREK